ncbi:histidine kinase [Isoptericola halotolerans]|uniref:histidine kinase n=1 Tax=Isoptericola halotolerans TaxID=300560 RepID=A0ABX2A743_9MICO|nr:histidine kinase [Isoptericola halotolerans]NOV98614.1 signal transduction histidine kinase [Isoptericola halotolerans]
MATPTARRRRPGPRGALRPLTSASTVRAGVYLIIGGVLAGAYLTLVVGFVQMLADTGVPRAAVVVLALLSAAIVGTPPFLEPVRTLQVLAVRTFLDVDAVDLPEPSGRPSPATRWRGAAWYVLHLVLGAAVTVGLLLAVPLATQLVLSAVGVDRDFLRVTVPMISDSPVAWVALAVVLLLALPYLVALARRVLRQAAVPLLGPDQSARIAELEADARRAAERGRLARELHDSVGHALTITTLQAAAAARQIDSDPEAARRALAAVEETGRTAMADLDHVLGLLRAHTGSTDTPPTGTPVPAPPARGLRHLADLVAEARRAGTSAVLSTDPQVDRTDVPAAVSREAYRIVQEALTNAVRHAPGATVEVALAVQDEALEIEVFNAVRPATSTPVGGAAAGRAAGGGRGLPGMADRVRLLDGHLAAGPEPAVAAPGDRDGAHRWAVRARLPLGARGSAT